MALLDEYCSTANVRTVKELLLDEQKLVTYVTLSKDLCIHVNNAKALLDQVVKEIRKNNASIKLNVCFLISGLLCNNSARTTVCSESEIEAKRKVFKNVFFQHIYSVSLGSPYVENGSFVSANKLEDFSLCTGFIKGSLCTKRSSEEIGKLKSNSQQAVNLQLPNVTLKKEIKENIEEVMQNGHTNENKVVKIHETKSDPVIKSQAVSPKKNTANSSSGKSNAKNGSKQSKGIAGFFTKSNSTPNTKSTKVDKETIQGTIVKAEPQPEVMKETKLEVKKETQSKVKMETQPEPKKEIQDECMDVDEETPIKKIKKEPDSTKKGKPKKSSSLNQIKKTSKVDKKRKRVLHVSDSESDGDNDPFADEPTYHESDDEIPPTPSTNTVKITSGILNPKKRRKIVDKTYTDEEGYILTRKEEVYESCSEEEVETVKTIPAQTAATTVQSEKENMEQSNKVKTEVSPKEKKAKNIKKKVSPPQKGKQSNIMNFFKKI